MSTLLLWLVPFAAADADCQTFPDVLGSVPAAGDVEVPLDVAPTLLFGESCTGGDVAVRIDLVGPDGVVLSQDVDTTGVLQARLPAITVSPEAPLLADTDYRLEVVGAGGVTDTIAFHTGTAVYGGLASEPAVGVTEATSTDGVVALRADVTAVDPRSAVFVVGVDGDGMFLGAGADYADVQLFVVGGGTNADGCVSVVQVDVTGAEHVAEDCAPVTVVPPSSSGCDHAGGVGIPLGGAIAALVRRRHRSVRS